MTTWRDHFDRGELRLHEETYGAESLADVTPCHGCGVPTPYVLLDSKPIPGQNPNVADYVRLECRGCYGLGWGPT